MLKARELKSIKKWEKWYREPVLPLYPCNYCFSFITFIEANEPFYSKSLVPLLKTSPATYIPVSCRNFKDSAFFPCLSVPVITHKPKTRKLHFEIA